jgi:hypothetical protein
MRARSVWSSRIPNPPARCAPKIPKPSTSTATFSCPCASDAQRSSGFIHSLRARLKQRQQTLRAPSFSLFSAERVGNYEPRLVSFIRRSPARDLSPR